jgi:hypothetical protein
MAKFKCVHTGNIVEFNNESDAEVMRKHNEYTEVFDYVGERIQLAQAPAVKTRSTKAISTEE